MEILTTAATYMFIKGVKCNKALERGLLVLLGFVVGLCTL